MIVSLSACGAYQTLGAAPEESLNQAIPSRDDAGNTSADAGLRPRGDADAVPNAETGDADAAPHLPSTPPGLVCLSRYYAGAPAHGANGWSLHLPSGRDLPWDDGRRKTNDEAINAPDLEDIFRAPYATGTITPVQNPESDPGRVRVEPLFNEAFGADEASVLAQLEAVEFLGQNVRMHRRAAPALKRVVARLQGATRTTPSLAKYLSGEIGGTYVRRNIANTSRISAHAYGLAIDIVVKYSSYWEWDLSRDGSYSWRNQIPQAIVDAFESEGFVWGGRWYHYDTMHFEYRPELLDPACR